MFDEVKLPRHFCKYCRVLLFWLCPVFVVMCLVLSSGSLVFMRWIRLTKFPLAFWQYTLRHVFGFKLQLFHRIERVISLRTWSLLFVGIRQIVDEIRFIPRKLTREYGISNFNSKTSLPLMIQEAHLVRQRSLTWVLAKRFAWIMWNNIGTGPNFLHFWVDTFLKLSSGCLL